MTKASGTATATPTVEPPHAQPRTAAHDRLNVLIGTWDLQGDIAPGPDGGRGRMRGTDTYEWFPGKYFVIHRVDCEIEHERFQALEIIGYDPERDSYYSASYDGLGNRAEYTHSIDDRTLSIIGRTERFAGAFTDGGRTLKGAWQRRSDEHGSWEPWVDITLRKKTLIGHAGFTQIR